MMRLSIVLLCLVCTANSARAGDPRWERVPKEIGEWFARQMRPDDKSASCCGLADAYYADKFVVEDGRFYAIITDDREDSLLGRPHRPSGTRVEVPPHKFNDPSPQGTKDPVPVPHGIVFINADNNAICYFNPPNDG